MRYLLLPLLLYMSLSSPHYIEYDLPEFNNPPQWHELWDINTIKQLVKWIKINNITLSADIKERIIHICSITSILGKSFSLALILGKKPSNKA